MRHLYANNKDRQTDDENYGLMRLHAAVHSLKMHPNCWTKLGNSSHCDIRESELLNIVVWKFVFYVGFFFEKEIKLVSLIYARNTRFSGLRSLTPSLLIINGSFQQRMSQTKIRQQWIDKINFWWTCYVLTTDDGRVMAISQIICGQYHICDIFGIFLGYICVRPENQSFL